MKSAIWHLLRSRSRFSNRIAGEPLAVGGRTVRPVVRMSGWRGAGGDGSAGGAGVRLRAEPEAVIRADQGGRRNRRSRGRGALCLRLRVRFGAGPWRGGRRQPQDRGRQRGVAVAQAEGPLLKATFASLPMRSASSQCWTSRALRWLVLPSRLGASSGLAGRCALLAVDAESTYRAL